MIKFELCEEEKVKIQKEMGDALKEIASLKQSLRQKEQYFLSEKEQIFIELLEVFDAMESPLDYLKNNSEIDPLFVKRLPKSLGNVQQKLSIVLEKRQVSRIDIQGDKPDFTCCQVVDREERDDLEDQTITKVVRQGFRLGDKILRPVEVITAKSQNI
jgi:molecular chaperone GrpE